jgi:hypothetical protein
MTMMYKTAPFQEIKDTVVVSGVPYAVPVDAVNHPPHYKVGGIETIDYMKAKATPEEFKGHLRLTALKYLSRTGYKDDALQDLKKAQWYLNRLIEECEGSEQSLKGVTGKRYEEVKFDKAI